MTPAKEYGSQHPYKPEPEKNVPLTEQQVKRIKQRLVETRRTIEDQQIDREIEERWSGI